MRIPALFLFAVLLLTACGAPNGNEIPIGLDSQKELLKTKQQEVRELQAFIQSLQDTIAAQDSTFRQKRRTLVTLRPVERKDFKRFVEIQGAVREDELINVSSESGGRIKKLYVKEGTRVSKGKLVAELDLESLQKQINELETSLDLAVEVYERQKRLWDQNIGSEIQYLEAKNNKERIEKSLESLRYELSKSRVYAPISGTVESIVTESGEMAAPGAPIIMLLDTRRVKIAVDVPENYIRSVRKGDLVTVRVPALNWEKQVRVSLIGNTIDPSNRTFKVEVELPNTGGVLKPNLLATMLLKEFEEKDAVVVPLNLVQQEVGGKDYVFIKGEGGDGEMIAKKVYVRTGESYEDEIIITQGLEGDEALIDEGARGLANNELIQIQAQAQQTESHGGTKE